jgi:peptidoglycan/xylan/chitin deacetylase (PgdA/CDA1 family)
LNHPAATPADALPARAVRWPWPPLLQATVAWHTAAALALGVHPAWWPWLLGAIAGNHLVISVAGLVPRSTWLGANLTRLPAAAAARHEVALTIDDGPDPRVTPAVLDQLQAAGAHATFFCIAARAQAHPDLVREILRRGHSIQNHSQRHVHTFSLLGPRATAREIGRAQASLQALTGEAPVFFRAPAGLRNPFLAPVLHRMGLRLASWTRRGFDTRERDPRRVLARLTRNLGAGDILLLHDGHAAVGPGGRAVVLDVLPALLRALEAAGLKPVTLPQAMRSTTPSPPPRP